MRVQKSGRHGPAALECFFGDIPAASELNSPSFNERKAERNKLIQNKAKKMIEEYNKNLMPAPLDLLLAATTFPPVDVLRFAFDGKNSNRS
ncbi:MULTISPECIES: hypothetical protein [Brevibacillus]|uniref:hypothetical protein n=1 Tax=Brevibacillus TaxID=55080 RepID=UPI003877A476